MAQVPQPPTLPFLGNVRDIDPNTPVLSFQKLAQEYGECFRVEIGGHSVVVVNSYELLNEICDDKRFTKRPSGSLLEVRNGVGDALFTAFGEEENWGIAHRILMPKLGPLAIQAMFDEMHEVACQLVSKWARLGPQDAIDPTDDFTRLTLDSIALCAMDIRFNSFYKDNLHPFVDAMKFFLLESGKRSARPSFLTDSIYRASTKQYWESIEVMKSTAMQAINERRQTPKDKVDLMNAMLYGKDPKTEQGMSETSIIQNAITFLIAGHETTSGLLSFLFVFLIQNLEALKTAQEEVDRVVGQGPVTPDHMSKLPYITACLRETLRLWPTAPNPRVVPIFTDDKDYPVHIGKKRWIINKGESIIMNLPCCHLDPLVYGEDAKDFKPERMLDDKFNKLPPNAWKPFGNGMRGCIGRAFAWQESHIAIALILQNFDLRAPPYKLEIAQTLTVKPKHFQMHASLRAGLDPMALERRVWNGKEEHRPDEKDVRVEDASIVKHSPMSIFYGSNSGTCESLAQSLANHASSRGYHAEVQNMDSAADKIPKDHPVIFVTSSYEGEPPDNAARFIKWLEELKGGELAGASFAVFGCGHHDWSSTFHRIPKLTDELLSKRGATRIATLGLSDTALGHISDDFDQWNDDVFWPAIAKENGDSGNQPAQSFGLDVEVQSSSRSSVLRQDVSDATVTGVNILTAPGEPVKRHIALKLPDDMNYKSGDYLAVLPVNPDQIVKAIMARFGLAWDSSLHIKEGQHTPLPQGKSLPIHDILSSYVELNSPATKKNVATISQYIQAPTAKTSLEALTSDIISSKNVSVFALLIQFPASVCPIPFGDFLAMLPSLHVRQYSISSSPLQDPHSCTLTYSVVDAAARLNPNTRYLGTASNYLEELLPGDRMQVAVRSSSLAFHPPGDSGKTPVLMICAGSGLAPFRGFVQERAELKKKGKELAPALLFIGCRHPERDSLYADEFSAWAKDGVVDVRYAYSKAPELSEGCKYVQDRLWKDREAVVALWKAGARVFICGSTIVGESVKDAAVRACMESRNITKEEAEKWFEEVKKERLASDVFA